MDLLVQKGFEARKLNAITDSLGGPYHLVLANAVLLHFSREEIGQVLQKVFDVLRPGGTFAFTLKQGGGEKWSEEKLNAPRYFCFWTKDQVHDLIKAAGFTNVKISGDKVTTNATWLQIIAKKG